MSSSRPFVLCILDGFGWNERTDHNAIAMAETPTYDEFLAKYPRTLIEACGKAVGLRPGLIGNSEVGHMNIGSGRIIWQDITRIDNAIESGELFENPALTGCIRGAKQRGTKLHLMGLVSDGGVHSAQEHYLALLQLAAREGLAADQVMFHAFLDGRDTAPKSGIGFLENLQGGMQRHGVGRIATVSGRYWAMDRDQRWERVEKAWKALVRGQGHRASDPIAAVRRSYEANVTDEFVDPIVIEENGEVLPRIASGDGVIFFNFRADRARQLVRAFIEDGFDGFDVSDRPKIELATLTKYSDDFDVPAAYERDKPKEVLGEVLCRNDRHQLRIAETEKYAHVTFFFNGGLEEPFPLEERILVPSPKVATYDLQPEMSAPEVTDRLIARLQQGGMDLVVLNFANPDMVGHTGDLKAAIRAVEAVDQALGRIWPVVKDQGGGILLTADHGNCEQMVDYDTGEPHTAHTTNPVPLILVDEKAVSKVALSDGGRLCDIAPTILEWLEIDQPEVMTGHSLLQQRGAGSPSAR
ncbi:MAG: 2,3-bisphosphoglycerate-independent phosphoglycerate mutase [Planctomycetota bacterium]